MNRVPTEALIAPDLREIQIEGTHLGAAMIVTLSEKFAAPSQNDKPLLSSRREVPHRTRIIHR